MSTASMRSPHEHHAADDQKIAVDERRNGASAVRRQEAEVFAERSFPQHFPIAVERDQVAAHAKNENVTCRRIADRRRPADTMRRNVAEINIEAMFPQDLAGIGVETHQSFLQRLALPRCVYEVQAIAHHDWRRTSAERSFP